ncbi:MAG: flagellar assembly protein FliW [Verrucomicrobiota bacterium]
MNTQSEASVASATAQKLVLHLPFGLIGFRHLTHFELETVPGSEPFQILRSLGEEVLEFVVVEPRHVVESYEISLRDEDVESLRLSNQSDAMVFNVVVIHSHEPQYVTVNLVGPILVNRLTLLGQQVLITNSADFSVEHVLVDHR